MAESSYKKFRPVVKGSLDSSKIFHPELLKGKVALITGGSNGGMLKEIAKSYLKHGAKAVALMSRNAQKLQAVADELTALYDGECFATAGDVRKIDSCRAAVKAVVEKYGRIDILVNGAAGNFLASASKLSSNGFRSVLEIDTLGTFNMSQSVFQAYMGKNGGTIINISALLHWNGTALQAHSSAAKAGVDALTKVLAAEWGPHGIRVVGIVPGAIQGTEGFERLGDLSTMNNKSAANAASQNKATSSKAQDSQFGAVPLMRLGEVEDIANTALYLASPAANYVTGVNTVVDGGSFLTYPNMLFAYPDFIDMWAQAKL